MKKMRFGQTRDLYLYPQPRLARHATHVPIRLLVKFLSGGLARFFFKLYFGYYQPLPQLLITVN